MPLPSGTSFGEYEVVALLGAGGMGEVYRARDARLGRDVALKILPPVVATDPERLARFEREARLLAALSHPNIATIHGLERADGIHGLVLELIEGDTLADRVARGPCRLDETLKIAAQLADALEAAHQKGIIHRDLKPANVKLTADGLVKVLDFGLAKALEPEDGPAVDPASSPTVTTGGTRDGVILGTAAYMSPEQARGLRLDERTDIWAFGCVLYELVTGRAAFLALTVSDTLAAVLEHEPDWDALPRGTPHGVRRVLQRCLAKDPRHRFRHIADVRIGLEDALGDSSGSRAAVASQAVSSSRHPRWTERVLWAGAIAALATIAWWLVYRADSTPRSPVVEIAVHPPRGATFVTSAGGPWPMVSPDGSRVAFVALSQAGQQIWVRSLDSVTARPLEGTEGAIRPFWSPDSQAIAFFANGQLRRVDLESRTARVLCDASYQGGLSGTWGDNVIVFNGAGGLRRVPAGGGSPALVLEDSDDVDVAVPSFLPDGRRFLHLALRNRGTRVDVCLASVDSPERKCVPGATSPVQFTPSGHLLYVREGALQAQRFDPDRLRFEGDAATLVDAPIDIEAVWQSPPFSASGNGVLAYYARPGDRLAWFDRTGAQLESLPETVTGGAPAVSPDGAHIVMERRDPRTLSTDLWLYDRALGTGSRFTFTPASDTWPAFSPDGTQVLYESSGGFFRKPVSGGAEVPVIAVDGVNPDWSSDGRFVVYQSQAPRTGFDLWVAPLASGGAPFPIAQTEHGEREGAFSPDVRWIAYDSTESGRREVWVQPFPPSGARWQISTEGGVSPRWRADGRELFFVAADGMLTSVAVNAGATFRWGAPLTLFRTVFRGGTYAPFAVSKDGQRFLMATPPASDQAPIIVVLNWAARMDDGPP